VIEHHWTPDQVRAMDLGDFVRVVRATDAHNRALAEAFAKED